MKELELCKPSVSSLHGKRNLWQLYNSKNHRCNNRTATFDELSKALNNWNNTETQPYRNKLQFIINEYYKFWLPRCVLATENMTDFNIICLVKIDNEYDKVVLFNKEKQLYYLRSITDSDSNTHYKNHDNSQEIGWYIDHSTLSAPAEFWIKLKSIINHPTKWIGNDKYNNNVLNCKNKTAFWKKLHTYDNRDDVICFIKKNLTETEKLWIYQ